VLRDADVPCFAWPERTAAAAGAAVRCGRRMHSALAAGPPSDDRPPRPAAAARAGPGGLLAAEATRSLLAGAGIPVTETVRCASAEAAVSAAERLGYPVVAKVDHPDLVHKSDAGGVRLGLDGPRALRTAAGDLLALAPGAAVLVQHQHEGAELMVGGLRDPEFGAVVLAGLGGVLVEVLRDVQLAVAPVDEAYARGMLGALRGAAVLDGVRGRPAVDQAAVARVIARVSELMAGHPEIAELDLNPLLAGPRGCVAVDWRIRVVPR
jgi:acetyltransferase